jgi:hypothetical protein
MLPAGGFVVAVLIVAIPISSCRKSAPAPSAVTHQPASQQPMQVSAPPTDEQSCRAFVQKFYDWYWNDSIGSKTTEQHFYQQTLDLKPAALSPELIRLIKRDDARQIAVGGIANLDFDPFLNSQDPEGKFDVVQVTVKGGVCRAMLSQRDIVTEAKRTGPSWVFSNFYYSFYSEDRRKKEAPDDDLVHILSQP